MIGTIFIFIKNKNTNNIVLSSLAFAAGVMICVSITDLIPESINLLNSSLTGLSIIIMSFLSALLGIIISMLIDYYLPDKPNIENNKKKAILYTGISAISEPFGAFLAYLFLRNVMNDLILGILFSIIAGIMLQISFCELLPTARRYNNSKRLYIFFLIGVLFMLIKFIL